MLNHILQKVKPLFESEFAPAIPQIRFYLILPLKKPMTLNKMVSPIQEYTFSGKTMK
jgi:hypothetical protein